MYSEKLEKLIEHALADGVLTEKEKQVLLKNAEAEGVDPDEFEMVLEARLYEKTNSKIEIKKIKPSKEKIKNKPETIETIICKYRKKMTDSSIYWLPDIPEKKLSNAMNSYITLDDDEQIILLYDSTVFGSAKEGFCLSTKGLYWKNLWEDGLFNYIDYSEIETVKYEKNDLHIVDTDNDQSEIESVDAETGKTMVLILNRIKKYVEENNIVVDISDDDTLEKVIRMWFKNEGLTGEKKQELFQFVEEGALGEIDLKTFENVFNKIESSLPKESEQTKESTIFDKITGRQAYLDHKKAKSIKADSEAKYKEYSEKTTGIQQDLNHSIEEYGRRKLETLKRTLGVFLVYLQRMEQRYKENYYELMDGCDFPKAYVAELGQLNMNSNELLKTAATGGGFALAAVAGVPAAVTSAVGALAAASTGTAISSLSGAAATNAVMAWLGGGAIAAGGGGMAAGTVVLAGITYTVTGVVALAATGLVASSVFAKKLTQAQKYSSEVDIACEKMKTSWAAMEGIKQRVNELMEVTMNVYDKCIIQLAQLEPVISCFDTKSKEHILIFQKTALLVKSISELAKTPLFGDDMNLSGESEAIITRTRKILNTEL